MILPNVTPRRQSATMTPKLTEVLDAARVLLRAERAKPNSDLR